MHTYIGFGLHIDSDLEFPELMPAGPAEADIRIERANLAGELSQGRDTGRVFSDWSPESFMLHIPSVGYYVARKGEKILVDPYPGADMNSFRLYLLSIAMTALLAQKKMVLLHASAIILDEELVLFMGQSGAGKSSMAAELHRNGYLVYSDDVCVLLPPIEGVNKTFTVSSYPMMKLWRDTIHAIGDEQYTEQHRIWPEEEKYGQFFHESFQVKPMPVSRVFILNPVEEEISYGARQLKGMDAFQALAKNTYRSHFIQDMDLQKLHFASVSNLARYAVVTELSRSTSNSDIGSFTRFVLNLLHA
jgi:energy-coupling factor transporter ATP-binding protein EcfA2